MSPNPSEVEISTFFRTHHGPRLEAAGLTIQFHYNQAPGMHFKVEPSCEGYRRNIEKGIHDGMALRFPDFPKSGSVYILRIEEDPIGSCDRAFYLAARTAIDLAYSLKTTRAETNVRK